MNGTMTHRGPDDSGIFRGDGVLLGHRRLSIIDLASGHQPMTSDDGAISLVYNGEMYSYREERQALEEKGRRFSTTSDTEVILRLYEEYGMAMVSRLRGIFAIAIWDARTATLHLIRDRLGVKPLVYGRWGSYFCFASEVRAMTKAPGFSTEINPDAVVDFMGLQCVPSPNTIYRNVFKLPPAHYLTLRNGELTTMRYWDVAYRPKIEFGSVDEGCDRLWDEIKRTVELEMVADVPVGVFLSGGVDSSLMAVAAAEVKTDRIRTFSIGFSEEASSELKYARMVAERLGTDHNEFIVTADHFSILPELIDHFGEPFGDPAVFPTYFLSKMTSQSVKVALSGDGGDETFGGYDVYRQMQLAGRIHAALPSSARAFGRGVLAMAPQLRGQMTKAGKAYRYLNAVLASREEEIFPSLRSTYVDTVRERLFTPSFLSVTARASVGRRYQSIIETCSADDFVDKVLGADLKFFLPEILLYKTDITSMIHSLEVRLPFLDYKLVDMVARLPVDFKIRGGVGKFIAKKILARTMGEDFAHRSKMGFSPPIRKWFRDELSSTVKETLLGERCAGRGVFQPMYASQLISEHIAGTANHSGILWNMLNFELWAQRFLD